MKKYIALILMLCLLLTGCGEGGIQIPGLFPDDEDGTVASTRPADPIFIDYAAPAFRISFAFGPELEVTTNFALQIQTVTANNADANAILDGQDFTSKSYFDLAFHLLEAGQKSGHVKDGSSFQVVSEELMTGAWAPNFEGALLFPMDVYQKNNGITLQLDYTPAGQALPQISNTHSNIFDESEEIICYAGGSIHAYTKEYYKNGDFEMRFYSPNGYPLTYKEDGSYAFGSKSGDYTYRYSVYADGTRSEDTIYGGLTIRSVKTRPDGTFEMSDNFFENGKFKKIIFTAFDGSVETDDYYYENDQLIQLVHHFADGSHTETFYENGETVRSLYKDLDGFIHELFFENGDVVREINTFSDGSKQEYIYQNGTPVKEIFTAADGTVTEKKPEIYDEPATIPPEASDTDIQYTYYDSGAIKSELETTEDGNTIYTAYYESGEIQSDRYTWADGSYQHCDYREDGSVFLMIISDGSYYAEQHFDEAGILLYEEEKDNGMSIITEYTYYDNGNAKTSLRTEANGDTMLTTYREDGTKEYYQHCSNGESNEYFYDKTEVMTHWIVTDKAGNLSTYYFDKSGNIKAIEETVNGMLLKTEYTYYSDGEVKTLTETWENGDWTQSNYRSEGFPESKISYIGSTHQEEYYDENGRRTKYYNSEDNDATWIIVEYTYYPSGQMKTSADKYSDGDYVNMTFYETGIIQTIIMDLDGKYVEQYFDENEKVIKQVTKDEEGNLVETYY